MIETQSMFLFVWSFDRRYKYQNSQHCIFLSALFVIVCSEKFLAEDLSWMSERGFCLQIFSADFRFLFYRKTGIFVYFRIGLPVRTYIRLVECLYIG
jgi:hypothetical protein